MTIEREVLLELLRDPEMPWAINMGSDGDRVVSVETWVEFANQQLGGRVDRATLETATDELVGDLGGEKLELQGLGEFVRETVKRLVGRGTASTEMAYTIPARALGQVPRSFAQQYTDVVHAKQSEGEQRPS